VIHGDILPFQHTPEILPVNPDERIPYPDAVLRSILEAVRTIAVVGASDRPERPSHGVMTFLQKKGYRIIPVNPGLAGQTLLGETVFGSLTEIPHSFDMVDIFRKSDAVTPVVEQALALAQKREIAVIWLQLGVRNDQAAALAEAAGLAVVMNRCPKQEYSRIMPG
jgi:predicted CoA-binding protein